MLETNSAAFAINIVKQIMKEFPGIAKQVQISGFSFKFMSSLCIRSDKLNVAKGLSESPSNLKYINNQYFQYAVMLK